MDHGGCNYISQRCRGSKVGKHEVAIFPQIIANLRQRRLWVLKSLKVPLSFLKIRIYIQDFAFLDKKFRQQKALPTIFR